MELTPESLSDILGRQRGASAKLAEALGLSPEKVSLMKSGQRQIKDAEGQKIRKFLAEQNLLKPSELAEAALPFDGASPLSEPAGRMTASDLPAFDLHIGVDHATLIARITLENVDAVRRQLDLAEQILRTREAM